MIVAGFGFRAAATAESLSDAYRRASAEGRVCGLATAADKASSDAFTSFAKSLSLPAIPVDAALLSRQTTVTRAAASLAARGSGSVAEAAALAAAGPGARLLAARVISGDGMATCALAEGGEA